MTKVLKRIITTVLLISVLSSSVNVLAVVEKGDMNGNGEYNLSDAREILRIAATMESVDEKTYESADVDGNGEVNLADAKEVLLKAVDIDELWSLEKIKHITPSKKHSSSTKKKYCRIKEYSAETLASSPVNDKSNPLYSPLLKGTYDYIKSGPVTSSDSEDKYYILGSGRRVYADDVKVIKGYEMPYNKAELESPITYDEDSTKFYIALDWKVPFNVTVKPQDYEKGYDSRPFNVKGDEFTGKYMDITFYYTKSASGTLTFPESDTIKSCKWRFNKKKKTATLRVYFRTEGEFYGYNAYYNEDNYLVISVKEPIKSLKGRTIEVDPGHGGDDPGAGSGTGVYESSLTYKISLQLKNYLEKAGAEVIMSRGNTDTEPMMVDRRLDARKSDPDMYISIHLDASTSKSVHGSSVYYYKNYSAPLAYAISGNLPKTLEKDAGYTMSNRGMHFYPFFVTRIENCPSVLVECGFISNTSPIQTPSSGDKSQANCDFKLLNSKVGQKYVAKGIYNGILDYYGI